MDFFEHQERARQATGGLVLLYGLFIIAIVAILHALVSFGYFLFLTNETGSNEYAAPIDFLSVVSSPKILLGSAGSVVAIILVATLVKLASLSQGGSKVAESLGGQEISPSTTDYQERRLLNIVEEMALASGVSMPRVFVMNSETGINAFAAGFSAKDAAIAVTRGALGLFSRDELQAVVGHEFSHILNGDMKLNIRMIGVLSGILCISLIGNIIMRIGNAILRASPSSRSRSKKDNGTALGFGLLLMGGAIWIIGSIGVLCTRIMQAMISRQRELLADASSVQFTRNPVAMAGALKLIGAYSGGSRLDSALAPEVSHMLFASGLKSDLFATHPPLETRIRQIDPSFDGDFRPAKKIIQARVASQFIHPESDDEEDLHRALLASALISTTTGKQETPAVTQHCHPTAKSAYPCTIDSSALPACLNPDEIASVRTTPGAMSCIFALVLSPHDSLQQTQLDLITQANGKSVADSVRAWYERQRSLPVKRRRMLGEGAVNTLRTLPKAEIQNVWKTIEILIQSDGQIDSFEFALSLMFKSRLLPDLVNSRRSSVPPTLLAKQASFVLQILAKFGAPTADLTTAAWKTGLGSLTSFGDFQNIDQQDNIADLNRFETSLEALVRLPPLAKREFLKACEAVVQYDGALSDIEDNFLFAIADVIDASGWNAVG